MSDVKVVAKNARVSFPHLVTKHASPKFPTSKPKFGIGILLNKKDHRDTIAEIDRAVDKICRDEKWTKASLKSLPYEEAASIVKDDGSPLAGYDEHHVAISAKSDNRVSVFDRDGTPLSGEEIESKIYGGCRCTLSFSIYPARQYRKICVELRAVKFWADDEPFGGRAPVTDAASEFGEDDDSDLL